MTDHFPKKLFTALLLLLLWAVPALCSEAGFQVEDRQAILARIQQAQAAIKTLQASFLEERHISGLKKPLTFEGKLYLNNKGLLFLHYLRPLKHVLRVKGDTVLLYVEGSKTADQVSLAGMQNGAPRPDFFKLNIKNFKGIIRNVENGLFLEETAEDRKIGVLLNPTTMIAESIEIKSENDDSTKIFLRDTVVNKPLPKKITNFRLPPVTKINVMNQQ